MEAQWGDHQEFEKTWWGNCTNTFGEEAKQLTYAHRISLVSQNINGKWPCYDVNGKSILDLGGGPVSMLLKTVNAGKRTVVDPCSYPEWIVERYKAADICYFKCPAENFVSTRIYDECWIYNVLQHVQDPEKIIKNAQQYAKTIRLFEWINIPAHEGHPHELRKEILDTWLGAAGKVEELNGENACHGTAYYGVFSCASTF